MSRMKDYVADNPGVFEASEYVDRGWWVLPLKAGDKTPHPLASRGYLSATRNMELIERWFERAGGRLNVGIAAVQSGLVIVDVDNRNLDERGRAVRDKLPDTYTVTTGDGEHRYYVATPQTRYPGKAANGIDIKHRGYVVAPPSVHPNGTRYHVTHDIEPVPAPDALLRASRLL